MGRNGPGPCSGVGLVAEVPAAAFLWTEGGVAGMHRATNPETKDSRCQPGVPLGVAPR